MMSHFSFALLAAALISIALALLGRRTARERVYSAVRVFLGCTVVTVAGAWLMYFLNG